MIARVQKDIPQKTIHVLRLDEPIDNLYEIIDRLPNKDQLDILFIKGIEKSLVDYIKPGIGGQGDYYKEDTVPRILGHLNLQRERFRDNFKMCFVFLLPLYALKYFIRRAPDFFDWRSGVLEFPTSSELVQQETIRIIAEGDYEEYLKLTSQERKQKILEIQEILQENHQTLQQKANLLLRQFLLFFAGNEYEEALANCDKALELQPNNYQFWLIRGVTLSSLARYEAAVASYEKALELQPNDYLTWFMLGIALFSLGKSTEAIASYEQALELQPNNHDIWHNRAILLDLLGKSTEALTSYEQALELQPNNHDIWHGYKRSLLFDRLERDEAVITSPNYHHARNSQGIAMANLGRWEEAIASYDKALQVKPDYYQAWYNRGVALGNLGRFEEAVASNDKALQVKPDDYQAWYNRGLALKNLGRWEEAIASYDKAVAFNPDLLQAWYNKACCYALLGNVDLAIENLQQAINLNPDVCRESAKTDFDFDSIRENRRFQTLIDS
jgi:tetratricopeptide (TPR) repeat protein